MCFPYYYTFIIASFSVLVISFQRLFIFSTADKFAPEANKLESKPTASVLTYVPF
jgi:hypothetical protein